MLNKIWFALLAIGIVYGFGKGAWNSYRYPAPATSQQQAAGAEMQGASTAEASSAVEAEERPPDLVEVGKRLNQAALDAATLSVEICIGLIGIMALWLGLLQIAREAGLVDAVARALRPVMRWLFPDVPDGHPAQGAMLMNMSANMLGLDNAATPLGLKAMQELQSLNPDKETATDAMAMFLAINTSSITLVPFTIIGYRAIKQSENPAEPMAGIVIVTCISTIVAITAARLLQKLPRYAASPPEEVVDPTGDETKNAEEMR